MSLPRDRGRAIALLVAGVSFMENLDGTVITTALPAMANSFGREPVELTIGITIYLITLAVFIPLSGWVAHRFGTRTVLTGAIALFTVASALCGLCQDLNTFVAARFLQGFAGAMMVPVGRLAVLEATPKHQLLRAVALITWPGLAAPVLGPPLGGLIATYASWPWIFFLNIPLGLVAICAALKLLSNAPEPEPRPFDATGFALTGIACLGVMIGFNQIGQTSGGRGAALILALSGMVGAGAVWHLRRHPHPLLDLSALRVQTFAVTIWGGTPFRIAVSALPFLLPLLFQVAFQWDAVTSGLLVLALFLGNLVIKPVTTPLLRRFGFRATLLGNGLLLAASIFACALLSPHTPLLAIAALLFVSGVARSVQYTCLHTLAFADVPASLMNGANTLFSTIQQITTGLGVAAGAIALHFGGWTRSSGNVNDEALGNSSSDFRLAFLIMGVISLMGLIDAFMLPRHAGQHVSRPARSS